MLNVKNTYLYEEDKPFFWLGDTAWLLLEKLSMDEILIYLKNRRMLGYNVIQVVLLYTLPDKDGIQSGMPVYDRNIYEKSYFDFADKVISYAGRLGIHVALLPVWGSFFKKNVLNEYNVERFAGFLVDRFGHHENLIWVLGGDVRGDINFTAFDKFGKALKARDKKHLMTFHPFGRTLSSRWFNDCEWLDFNMYQSGHRRYDQMNLKAWDDVSEKYYGEDVWKYVKENHSMANVKPCLDGEPSYEGIVQGLHDTKQPYWEEKDVRRYAYWSVFAGACGFTYGNNAVIQFYDPDRGAGAYGAREHWKEALHAPGGVQLLFLKTLMESVDFTKGCAKEDYLVSPQRERYHHIALFAGEDYLFAYDYCGDEFEVSLKDYIGKVMEAFWMNPQNGVLSYIDTYTNIETVKFYPVRRHEDSNDWVLVLKEKLLEKSGSMDILDFND